MTNMGRQRALLLEMSAIEDALVLEMAHGHRSLAEAARHTGDPATLRLARTMAAIADAVGRAAKLRAVVLDELLEDIAAETTMLTVPRPAKGRRGRQAARP